MGYLDKNPLLGLRGVRLSLCVPGIFKLQIESILDAIQQSDRFAPSIQILVPFVSSAEETVKMRQEYKAAVSAWNKEHDSPVSVKIGVSIDVPRAALVADKIAPSAEFLSFGLSELTELVFGLAKETSEKEFLEAYRGFEEPVLPDSPFRKLDQDGVGQMIDIGVEMARKANPKIQLGVYGVQAGDPESIQFLHTLGLNYIACPLGKVQIARIAAAQAVLAEAKPEEPVVEEEPEPPAPEVEETAETGETDDTRDSED
jgi:pyruvate,orthophosphate dikinase